MNKWILAAILLTTGTVQAKILENPEENTLWVENGKKTNCRLFANQNVQYYGYASDYTNLLTPGEVNTYAGYAGGNTDQFELKDMEVTVEVAQGEDLTIGIKTGNMNNNGVRSTNDNAGWFKVDFFRIHRISETTSVSEERRVKSEKSAASPVYDLQGRCLHSPLSSPREGLGVGHSSLKKGLYIADGKKFVVR